MTLPEPKNFDHYLGGCVKRRKPNIFKLFYKYEDIPNIYQLSAGMPNGKLFPIANVEASTVHHDSMDKEEKDLLKVAPNPGDLDIALQYGQASGMPALREWIENFNKEMIPCRYKGGFKTIATCGSTDGWFKVLQVFSDEWQENFPPEWRQGIIVEQFTYSIAAEAARVRGLNIVSVDMDHEGLLPEKLSEKLENWDTSKGKRPHILYTVSIGQNPTGATASRKRREEIYAVCQKYDVLIVEDEPYWFIQYDGHDNKCYFDVDTEGRVIRLDSFSKNFLPGSRLGYVTAQPSIIQRIFELSEEATQQPSGFTQLVVLRTLQEWGKKGWLKWLSMLRQEYEERRNITVAALEKYKSNPTNGKLILDFEKPAAGMFVWMSVRFDHHPLAGKLSELELSRAFWSFNATHEQPVLITPGYFFAPSLDDAEHMASFFRISFAPSEKGDLKKETEGFGSNCVEFFQIDDLKRAKDLVAKFPDV